MSVLSQLSSIMATNVMPTLSRVGVVETMSVSRTAKTRGTMGGSTPDGSTTMPYTSIPVAVEVDSKGGRIDAQGKPIALQTYILTFAMTASAGALISIDISTDKFIVDARSPIPARTYKIVCPADDTKVVNQFVCTEEF